VTQSSGLPGDPGLLRLLTGTWSLQGDLVHPAGPRRAFAGWGGVPLRMLYDRMKTVVTDQMHSTGSCSTRPRGVGRPLRLHAKACRPHRPRLRGGSTPVGYIREGLLVGASSGISPTSSPSGTTGSHGANVRIHGTHGGASGGAAGPPSPPAVAAQPHDPLLTIERQLSRDGFVSVRGSATPCRSPSIGARSRSGSARSPATVRRTTWLATYALGVGPRGRLHHALALAPTANGPRGPAAARPGRALPVRPAATPGSRTTVEQRDSPSTRRRARR